MGSYRKGLTLSLGLANIQVDLYSAKDSRRTSFNQLCPTHKTRLKQRLYCEADEDHEVKRHECLSGLPNGSTMKVVTPSSKPTFPKDEGFTLTPVPVAQLESATYPSQSVYYLQPTKQEFAEGWSALRAILQEGEVAFVTQGAIREGRQKLWRVDVFNDYLVLIEMLYPAEVRARPGDGFPGASATGVPGEPDPANLELMRQLVNLQVKDWAEFDSDDANETRITEWLEGAEIVEIPQETQEAGGQVMTLQEALRQSVEQAKAS